MHGNSFSAGEQAIQDFFEVDHATAGNMIVIFNYPEDITEYELRAIVSQVFIRLYPIILIMIVRRGGGCSIYW